MKRFPLRLGRYALFAARGGLVTALLADGALRLANPAFEGVASTYPGLAPWAALLVGVLQLIGAVMLLMPRGELPAALLLSPVLAGAAAAILQAGDGVLAALPAAALLALLLSVTVAALRREAREAFVLPDRRGAASGA